MTPNVDTTTGRERLIDAPTTRRLTAELLPPDDPQRQPGRRLALSVDSTGMQRLLVCTTTVAEWARANEAITRRLLPRTPTRIGSRARVAAVIAWAEAVLALSGSAPTEQDRGLLAALERLTLTTGPQRV